MTQEEEVYYETYFDLFSSEGWKQFVGDNLETYNSFSIEQIKDSEHLWFVKGQRSVLDNIVKFETMIRSAYDAIQEQVDDPEV